MPTVHRVARLIPDYIIEIDNQEKSRALPAVHSIMWPTNSNGALQRLTIGWERSNLIPFGCDYRIKGSRRCGIEKKSSLSEIHTNTGTLDIHRFRESLRKLRCAFAHRYLLLDGGFNEWHPYSAGEVLDGGPSLSRIIRECVSMGVAVIGPIATNSSGTRAKLSDYVVRLLIEHEIASARPIHRPSPVISPPK